MLVVDCSAVLPLCFPDEASERAETVLDALASQGAWVPALWWFEVWNVLLVSERRGRITPPRSSAFLADLAALPIRVDGDPHEVTLLSLARTYQLTAYDAAYLELALRTASPLATFDEELVKAAPAAGVTLFLRPGAAA